MIKEDFKRRLNVKEKQLGDENMANTSRTFDLLNVTASSLNLSPEGKGNESTTSRASNTMRFG